MLNSDNANESNTVAFYTLGCKTNQLESSAIADEFCQNGWSIVPFTEKASLYVINTCTVTSDSDSESRRLIRKAKRLNPDSRIAVTGCYAQVGFNEIEDIEGVNYIIGNNFKQDIYKIVQQTYVEKDTPVVYVSEIDRSRVFQGATTSYINRTRASLKIQDGCNFKCTYCLIWIARGPSRSIAASILKKQLYELVKKGFNEIVLTGINIGQYSDPGDNINLTALLEQLVELPGRFRLRLSSLDPMEVTPELLNLMSSTEKICPHLHLAVQSADNHVLKLMARRHRQSDLYKTCDMILKKIPHCSIGADIITGFPEETEDRFNSTCNVLSDLPLSYFHTFAYSPRKGTPALEFTCHITENEKKERTQQLIALSEKKNLHYRHNQLGKILNVIVEEKGDRGMCENFIHIRLNADNLPKNSFLKAKVIHVTNTETWGQVIR